jgi:hypothetical protein
MTRTLNWRGRAARASRALVLLIMVTLAGGLSVSGAVNATAQTTDLSLYYPNTGMMGSYFEEGWNYRIPVLPFYQVMWYEAQDSSHFKQYNSTPGTATSRCHWDQFATSTVLGYSETYNQCAVVANDVRYSGPISYRPRYWDGRYWSQSGRSSAAYYNLGRLACAGYIDWKGEILGRELISTNPDLYAIHDRTTTTTHWLMGLDPSGCRAGSIDHYQDNLYLVDQLPIAGSSNTAPALKRTVGGSLDRYNLTGIWDWDIWFDRWQRLPAHP